MTSSKQTRFVQTPTLERKDRKNKQSWTQFFEELEEKHGRSSVKRPSLMKYILPEVTFNRVAPILGWEETPKQVIKNAIWGVQFVEPDTPPTESEEELASKYSRQSATSEEGSSEEEGEEGESEEESEGSVREEEERREEEEGREEEDEGEGEKGEEEEEEEQYVEGEEVELEVVQPLPDEMSSVSSDLEVNPPTPGPRDLDKVDIPADNPYTNFIKRPMKKAARWRPPQEQQAEDGVDQSVVLNPHLSLSQKAAIITDKITKEFCEWLRGLCGMEKTIMTEEVLSQLFEIGFDMPAARSLCVKIQELSHVTAAIAKATNLPEAELHLGLHRELWKDIQAEKKEPRLIAFGRGLPISPPLRFRPPTEQLFKKWLEVPNVPRELVTMAEVFEGITDLRSVKTYCKWIESSTTLKPPEYLVEERMLGPRKKRDIVGSVEKDYTFIRSVF